MTDKREHESKLKAARESVAAWKDKLTETAPDCILIGVSVCPLCKLYFDNGCNGCPVKDFTGEEDCDGTPYHAAAKALAAWRRQVHETYDDAEPYKQAWRDAANEEIAFLEGIVTIVERERS